MMMSLGLLSPGASPSPWSAAATPSSTSRRGGKTPSPFKTSPYHPRAYPATAAVSFPYYSPPSASGGNSEQQQQQRDYNSMYATATGENQHPQGQGRDSNHHSLQQQQPLHLFATSKTTTSDETETAAAVNGQESDPSLPSATGPPLPPPYYNMAYPVHPHPVWTMHPHPPHHNPYAPQQQQQQQQHLQPPAHTTGRPPLMLPTSASSNNNNSRPKSSKKELQARYGKTDTNNKSSSATAASSDSNQPLSRHELVQLMGCTCKRTKCLKLYCQCFAAKLECANNCRCVSCHNTSEHAAQRQEAMRLILQRNPTAFDTKFQQQQPVVVVTTSREGAAVSATGVVMSSLQQQPGTETNDQAATESSVGEAAAVTASSNDHGAASTTTTTTTVLPKLIAHKTGCKCRKSGCMKKVSDVAYWDDMRALTNVGFVLVCGG